MGVTRVVAALLVLLLGACAPESIEPPEPTAQTTPEPIVPVMRDGRYRLHEIWGSDLAATVLLFQTDFTTSEVTDITLLSSAGYAEVITGNAEGTEAAVYGVFGLYFSYETTTGSGYACITPGQPPVTDCKTAKPTSIKNDSLTAIAIPDGTIELHFYGEVVLAAGFHVANTGSRVGWMEYLDNETGVTFTSESVDITETFLKDDSLPPHEKIEVACSVARQGCEVQEIREQDE